MLDSNGFVRAGWVHELRLYQFSTPDGWKVVVKGFKGDGLLTLFVPFYINTLYLIL